MRRMMLLSVLALCAGLVSAHEAPPLAWVTSQSIPRTRGHHAVYSVAQVQDVVFTATISPRVRGEHRLGLRLYTPRGHLYQTLTIPFAVPVARRGRHAPPPRPVVVTARLPVAGTPVVDSSLYGRWRVVPHLDQDDQPCGHTHRFHITH